MPEEKAKIVKKLMSSDIDGNSYVSRDETHKPQWVVIHNMGGGFSKAEECYNFFNSGSTGRNTSAHYLVDDKEVWKILEDSWKGHHCGTPSGPDGKKGCSNNNSIGIEMADGSNCDIEKAMELTIEIARHLLKIHELGYDRLTYHQRVNLGTDCPKWMLDNKKWDYFYSEVKKRNEEGREVNFDPSNLGTGNNGSNSGGTGSGAPAIDFDNRENWTNIVEVKGIVLVNMPPFHFTSLENKEKKWKEIKYNKEFHYVCDNTTFKDSKDKTLIAFSMQGNDRHTYIERALYNNKAAKYTLSVGIFTPDNLEDYVKIEKLLINRLGVVLYENGLKTRDLWREFDLNRAPSPFMYLDREQWKKFLREVQKQVDWRYKNFGEPTLPEKDPIYTKEEIEAQKKNIGKRAIVTKKANLRENPAMSAKKLFALENETMLHIDAAEAGYYNVTIKDGEHKDKKGWVLVSRVGVLKDEEANIPKMLSFAARQEIPQPEITPTMTHKEYLIWKSLSAPEYIDNYAGECEPYSKGLKDITEALITDEDRINSTTKNMQTFNENTIFYNVTEGAPGGSGHCVKASAELNAIYKPDPFKVEPIYPDLIVPPNYSPAENDIKGHNQIPLPVLENNSTVENAKDFDEKQLSFDYNLLKDKAKKTTGKPLNYLEPYPYDDKIYELENHSPKIKIDEIESRLYESNHPGDPIPQPIAKNFALIYDAMLNQSKKIEKRLVKLENVLATTLRNLGRVGSRMNINCVYYGGQDSFGKYKTIRCLRDDRVHDACSVTLDQCLACTRYEPILGQVYEILDETGANGSIKLDNMQMSYMNIDDLSNLNRVEKRTTKYKFVDVEKELDKPKSILGEWEEEDKKVYIESVKKEITDVKELEEKLKTIKQEDYVFRMNWHDTDFSTQEPDIKEYPLEGIKARYKAETQQRNPALDKELDKDVLEDILKQEEINNSNWVDTREDADTNEVNKYSSEDYYFEEFGRTDTPDSGGGVGPGLAVGSQARNKIVEMAKQICKDHDDLKACYEMKTPRTTDYTKPVKKFNDNTKRVNPNEPIAVYDCSSFVSCCYNHAGLKEITDKNTDAIIAELNKNQGKTFPANESTLKDALPGDIIVQSSHAGIYIGDNKIAHAATNRYPNGKDIRIDDAVNALKYSFADGAIFGRPKDLLKADQSSDRMSENMIYLLKQKEGFAPNIYRDSGGVPTIGYGLTQEELAKVKPPLSEAEATRLLTEYMNNNYYSFVAKAIKEAGVTSPLQRELDAMASLAYNLGVNGWKSSSVFKLYVKGERGESIHQAFAAIVKDNSGTIQPGLVKRREDEWCIFSGSGKKVEGYHTPPVISVIGENRILRDNNGYGAKPY